MLRFAYFYLICFFIFSQEELIQSGPMLGYTEMRESHIWIQSKKEVNFQIKYWPKDNKSELHTTDIKRTKKSNSYIAKFVADAVEPGKTYEYRVLVNGKEAKINYKTEFQTLPLWQWRNDPPEFSFAFGSCFYINEKEYDRPGKPYGSNFQILDKIYKQNPDFMIWMGDNTYLREADWNSKTGIYKRYTHTRSYKGLQPLLASVHHYATWDDHEFGPNDSDRGFIHKNITLKAFKDFWANPGYGFNKRDGIYTSFEWGDVQFFLMDNRYFRAPVKSKSSNKDYFGKRQLNWLLDALSSSKAAFKIIVCGGQVLNPLKIHENYANYEEERQTLLNRLDKEKIQGVLFFSGDRHHSEISKLERKNSYPLYDITISPLTAGSGNWAANEKNSLRLKNTFLGEQNFAIAELKGKRKDRKIIFRCFNSKGKEIWSHEIHENELKYKRN